MLRIGLMQRGKHYNQVQELVALRIRTYFVQEIPKQASVRYLSAKARHSPEACAGSTRTK